MFDDVLQICRKFLHSRLESFRVGCQLRHSNDAMPCFVCALRQGVLLWRGTCLYIPPARVTSTEDALLWTGSFVGDILRRIEGSEKWQCGDNFFVFLRGGCIAICTTSDSLCLPMEMEWLLLRVIPAPS